MICNSMEATWQIFNCPITANKPAIMHLPIHLENQQQITFDPNDASNIQHALQCHQETPLTQYFIANQHSLKHVQYFTKTFWNNLYGRISNGFCKPIFHNLHPALDIYILYIPLMKNYSVYNYFSYIPRDINHGNTFVLFIVSNIPPTKQHVLLSI